MNDAPRVTFHESGEFEALSVPRPEPRSLAYRLVRMGLARSPGDAAIIIAVSAALLIAVNIYLFAKAIPPPPTLGNDVPRPGETMSDYAR